MSLYNALFALSTAEKVLFSFFIGFFLTVTAFVFIMFMIVHARSYVRCNEVTDINKQKFLAELSRLLAFMTDEARRDVLDMYSNMFDEASEEQTLLQLLSSPTRQAVLIARAYSAKGGRLTSVADQDGDGTPEYAEVIGKIRQDALERGIIAEKGKPLDQISIFDETSDATAQSAVKPADAPAEPEKSSEAAEDGETLPAAETEKTEEPAKKTPGISFDEEGNIVFVDLDGDGIPDEPAPEPAAEARPDEKKALPVFPEKDALPVPPITLGAPAISESAKEPEAAEPEEEEACVEPQRKPRVLLLILYILLAVPLTLVLLAVLLVPAFISLAFAGLVGCLGIIAVTAAFGGGFAVFANILVVLGMAAMLLALALLFLWIFIWFIGSVMVGLVNGVISLGRKWCYKEVQAE